MAGGSFRPPSSFWQYWALAGMLVLTAAFWWGVHGLTLFHTQRPTNQVADGLLRFSLLFLTPAFIVTWAAAAWLRRRVGDSGYWQMLGLVAVMWGAAILVTWILTNPSGV
ncbi:hypothetical protein [Sphingopyxis yananensis]|uniref:hypothetical protein n=1 Tax=Sphingopyxis yananensis TaxID=2886687 RepID=UPI001D10794F|nr:hypothetical protein [Sphingopyxis yananensis]MCC2602978.1 hypothetical protein [Sphingopyxis yananensis]